MAVVTGDAVRERAPEVDPLAPVSLLWPPGQVASPGPARISAATLNDLDLRELVLVLAGHDSKREAFVTAVLQELGDAEQACYRQEVTEAPLADDRLARALLDAAALLHEIQERRAGSGRVTWSVSIVAKRVLELEAYVHLASRLRDDLARSTTALQSSRALKLLHAHLVALTGTPAFTALAQELPAVRATLDRVRSVTIGINLTRDLNPDSATILSIDATRVEGRGPLLDRLFGRGSSERALSPLYNVDLTNPGNPLSRDLQKLLAAVIQPVADAMGRYTHVNAQSLDHLEREIHFYLNAAELVGKLERAGLPTCRAELAPPEERVTLMSQSYNIGLALRTLSEAPTFTAGDAARRPSVDGNTLGIVTNSVTFDDEQGRVWILTGPNRGGKTTFTRSVGQAHVMVQAGLRGPAGSARLSPVGSIYTHFPTPESEQLGMGKLDEEAQRLAEVFRVATPHSLILLNEVLAGTSAIEALGLAVDAVRALRLLGARAIYTTHLHELPARCDEINETTPGTSLVGSLVAGVDQSSSTLSEGASAGVISGGHRRTFRIQPGPPQNVSYASEIAEQHGISFPQLQRLFQKRGLV
jgi:hypothetical protein